MVRSRQGRNVWYGQALRAVKQEKSTGGVGRVDGGKMENLGYLSGARDDGIFDDAAPNKCRLRRHRLEPVARQSRRTGLFRLAKSA